MRVSRNFPTYTEFSNFTEQVKPIYPLISINRLMESIKNMKSLYIVICFVILSNIYIPPITMAQDQQLTSHPDYATVNVRLNNSTIEFLNINVNDQDIGKIYRKNDLLTIQLVPGFYKFKTNDQYWASNTPAPAPELMALFDLEVSPGSVVLLECYSEMGGVIFKKIPKDAVLQEWDNYCPGGDLTENSNVKACVKPYRETNVGMLEKQGLGTTIPQSACYLSDNHEVLKTSNLVESEIDFITNEAFEFAQAEELNTVSAYQDFINTYPDGKLTSNAFDMINHLEMQNTIAAQEQKIRETQQRDAALPLQVRKDKYLIALTGHLKQQEFEDALFYIDLLDQLNVELSPSFEFFWGEALLRTGQTDLAVEKLYSYINNAGTNGTYYNQALQLTLEAESMGQ